MKKVICHDIKHKRKTVDANKLVFRPAIYGLLIEGNKILLSKQWDGYDFPGGGVKIHETLKQAIQREFWEETGVKVEAQHVVACETSFFILPFSKQPTNSIVIYFLCKKLRGKPSVDYLKGHEKQYVGMPEWIDLKYISKIKFYNSVDSVKIIRQAIKIIVKFNDSQWQII